MNKARNIISILIGSVILTQMCSNMSKITGAIRQLGFNIGGGLLMGFGICLVIVIVMISVFILQNVLELVAALIYRDGSAEENKFAGMLNKISSVSRYLYQIVGAAIFGVMGIIGLCYPGLTGRDVAVEVVSGIFILFALIVCIQSIRSIVSIARKKM